MPKVTGKFVLDAVKSFPLPAFITGSRAYGVPRTDSDLDLVVFMNMETYKKLIGFADKVVDGTDSEDSGTMDDKVTASLSFGKLNIISVVDEKVYEAWKKGTEFLKTEAPATRGRAIQVLDEFKRKVLCQK